MSYDLTARLRLKDNMSKPLKKVSKQTRRLSDAANRSTDNLNKMTGEMKNSNRSFSKFTGNAASATAKILGLAAAVGGTAIAYQGLKATFGGAAELESNMISMEHFLGLTRSTEDAQSAASDYVDYLKKNANVTPFQTADVMDAGRRSIQVAGGDIDQAKNMLSIAEDMAALNPNKSLNDSMEALADLAVGETERMKEFGFKISAEDLKAAGGAVAVMNNDVAEMFEGGAEKLAESSTGLLSTITGSFKAGLADMGTQALDDIKPQLKELADFMSGGGMTWIQEKGSDFLVGAVDNAIDFGNYIIDAWPTIKSMAGGVSEALEPIGIAIESALDLAKSITGYIIDNWPQVRETVVGVTTAVLASYAAFKLMTIVSTITALIRAYRAGTLLATAAQLGLNLAMLANPFAWIALLIGVLVGAGVWLYRNFDTVKEKAGELWQRLLDNPMLALVGGPIGALLAAGILLYQNFDTIKAKAGDMLDSLIHGFKTGVNTIVGLLNTMIDAMNDAFSFQLPDWLGGKKFSVDIPNISEMAVNSVPDSFAQNAGMSPMAARGVTDGSHYHGLDRVPYDGYTAKLHEGERIQTKQEANQQRNGGGSISIAKLADSIIIREDADIEKLADELAVRVIRAVGDGA